MSVAALFHVLKSMVPMQSGGNSLLTGVARLVGPSTAPWAHWAEFYTSTALAPAGPTATLTTDQLLGGMLLVTPTGNTTYTLPIAAQMQAAIPRCQLGHSFRVIVKNLAPATFTVTLAAGANGTMNPTDSWVLAPGAAGTANTIIFDLVMTAVGASPTYTCYSEGKAVS